MHASSSSPFGLNSVTPFLKDVSVRRDGVRVNHSQVVCLIAIMSDQIGLGTPSMLEEAELPQGMQEHSAPAQSTSLEPKARVVLTYSGLSRCSCAVTSLAYLAAVGYVGISDCKHPPQSLLLVRPTGLAKAFSRGSYWIGPSGMLPPTRAWYVNPEQITCSLW